MGLEEILRALEEEGAQTIKQVAQRSEAQARAILEEAERQAVDVEAAAYERETAAVATEQAKILNAARLEAKQLIARAREGVIDGVFEAARTAIITVDDAGRTAMIERMVREAVVGQTNHVHVTAAPQDITATKNALEELGMNATVETDDSDGIGIIVSTDDGRVQVRNTIDARFRKARELLRADVAQLVFGSDADNA